MVPDVTCVVIVNTDSKVHTQGTVRQVENGTDVSPCAFEKQVSLRSDVITLVIIIIILDSACAFFSKRYFSECGWGMNLSFEAGFLLFNSCFSYKM